MTIEKNYLWMESDKMPQIIQKGKKNMMYCNCNYCNSYISFYVNEIRQHMEYVFDHVHVWGDIKCPSCNHKITLISDGEWKKGVVNA